MEPRWKILSEKSSFPLFRCGSIIYSPVVQRCTMETTGEFTRPCTYLYIYIYIYTHIYVRSFRTYESITIKIYVRFCRRYLRCIRVTRIHVPISIFYRFHRFTPSIVANRKSNAKFFNLRLDTRDRVSRVESTRPINSVLILVVRTFIIVRQQIRNSSLLDSFVRSITFESNIASFDSNH